MGRKRVAKLRADVGSCAVKECVLTWGDLALCLKGRRRNRSKKSAEAIVVASLGRRAEREGELVTMLLGSVKHQKLDNSRRTTRGQGEAKPKSGRDETRLAQHGEDGLGQGLLEQALARGNMIQAWKRVKANRGSAGVDGLDIAATEVVLKRQWPEIRESILNGTYRPKPVRRVQIDKPDGGKRELGIPTVTDRLIQQALLQVLQTQIDPSFSNYSYGFRPGRRAHDAVLQAQRYVQEGRRIVVFGSIL